MPADPEQLRVFAERYTAAWCSMDPAAVAAHFTPEGSLTINGGTPALGRDEVTAVAASFYEAAARHAGLLRRPGGGRGADRVPLDVHGHEHGPGRHRQRRAVSGFESWRIGEDGLIAASTGSYDADEYARQLAEGV